MPLYAVNQDLLGAYNFCWIERKIIQFWRYMFTGGQQWEYFATALCCFQLNYLVCPEGTWSDLQPVSLPDPCSYFGDRPKKLASYLWLQVRSCGRVNSCQLSLVFDTSSVWDICNNRHLPVLVKLANPVLMASSQRHIAYGLTSAYTLMYIHKRLLAVLDPLLFWCQFSVNSIGDVHQQAYSQMS